MREEIHIFGGQGWSGLFHHRTVAVAQNDACTSSYTRQLLNKCHKFLVKDASSLYSEGHDDVAQFLSIFTSPQSLLEPPEHCHVQPIVQGTILCLFQLLRYLARVPNPSSYHEAFDRIYGTTGFCSGIIPSVVVASSPTIEDFVENGAQAFRMAFWLGFHAGKCSQGHLSGLDTVDAPWAYSLNGLSQTEVAQLISGFNSETKADFQISLAGILRDSNTTVSGASLSLKRFLSRLPSSCVSRPIAVNAHYHGGERMNPLVQTIMRDFERFHVKFPDFEDLRQPIISPFDGSELNSLQPSKSLAQHMLELILVKHVDWLSVLRSIHRKGQQRVAMVYGPSPHLLVPSSIASTHTGLEKSDVSHENADVQLCSNYRQNGDDIAIIGIGLDLPNGSNLDDFWDTLKNGVNCVSVMPEDRFPWRQYVDKDAHSTPYHGNFVSNPWSFDSDLFNISPREAKSMDPQQRMLLQCSYHALQHAGYVPGATKCFQRSTFGCYVGAATADYVDRMSQNIDVYYSPGTLRAFLSGRISYYFGHSGPSVVVDTACSGSLVAIHQACRSLIANECSAALAGGVNVICGPHMQRGLARAHFLSPTGQCRPFDAKADGYCRGEGCTMFVLKRLSDAIAENDRILGVIKGTGVNQSGEAASITHPHAATQQALFEAVLKQSKVLPDSITAVEAHGTGTQAGDPVEFMSIASVLGNSQRYSSPLIMSSIKGNIGHAEAASGGAGLAKLIMMIANGQVPGQVGLEVLNPKIAALKNDRIVIPRQLTDWTRVNNMPRRALLNNFGAAGSNACLILEEYIDARGRSSRDSEVKDNSSYVFALSAKDDVALERYRQSIIQNMSKGQIRLRDLAYTSTARRTLLESRIVIACDSTEQLLQSLRSARVDTMPSEDAKPRVVFVFSGQGSDHVGMGTELFETTPHFRDDILRCEQTLVQAGYPSILPLFRSSTVSTASIAERGLLSTHCALFAVEYALARLWSFWGLRPDAMLGHSFGEYAAFVAAGVLSVEDAILTIAHRATLLETTCELGATSMLSVSASASYVQDVLSSTGASFEDLIVACDNSPRQCVVSGSVERLEDLALLLSASGVKSKKLSVPFGYHSSAMEAIRLPLNDFAAGVQLKKPSLPLGLGLLGRMHCSGDIDHTYFASQAISPVRFREVVEDFLSHQVHENTIFLEVGPHPIVIPMIRSVARTGAAIYLNSLRQDKKCWMPISESIAELLRCGVKMDLGKIYEGQDVPLVDMPLYPFAQEDFNLPYEAGPAGRASGTPLQNLTLTVPRGCFLSPQMHAGILPEDQVAYGVNHKINKLIEGHSVAGLPLCPASLYIELALQAALEISLPSQANDYVSVTNVIFPSPLVARTDISQPETSTRISLGKTDRSDEGVPFSVTSQTNGYEQTNCQGRLQNSTANVMDMPNHIDTMSLRFRSEQRYGQLIKRKMLYETIFSRVVAYSEQYQTIDYLELSDSGKSAFGSFRLRQSALLEDCVSQPVFIDTLLHAAGFLANCSVSASEVCICSKIQQISICATIQDYTEPFRLYTEISSTQHTEIGNTFAYDADERLVGSIQGISFRRLRKEAFTQSLHAGTRNAQPTLHAREKLSEPLNGQYQGHDSDRPTPIASGTHKKLGLMRVVKEHTWGAKANGTNGTVQSEGHDSLAVEINNAIAEVTGLSKNRIHPDANLQQLGLDSLMAFELLDVLKSRLGLDVSHTVFESCQTSKDIVRLVESAVQPLVQPQALPNTFKHLSTIQAASNQLPPLYLIHDGSGVCSMYKAIGNLGRDVFGISCNEKRQFQSINDMAMAYADLVDTSGPFILGGWSFGGVVAHKMAQILHERRAAVQGVVMIDSPCPTAHKGIPVDVLQSLFRGRPDWLLRNFEIHAAILSSYSPNTVTAKYPVALLRSAEAVDTDLLGGTQTPFLSDGPERQQQLILWKDLLGPSLFVLDIPGNHFQVFEQDIISKTSEAIAEAIHMMEHNNV